MLTHSHVRESTVLSLCTAVVSVFLWLSLVYVGPTVDKFKLPLTFVLFFVRSPETTNEMAPGTIQSEIWNMNAQMDPDPHWRTRTGTRTPLHEISERGPFCWEIMGSLWWEVPSPSPPTFSTVDIWPDKIYTVKSNGQSTHLFYQDEGAFLKTTGNN